MSIPLSGALNEGWINKYLGVYDHANLWYPPIASGSIGTLIRLPETTTTEKKEAAVPEQPQDTRKRRAVLVITYEELARRLDLPEGTVVHGVTDRGVIDEKVAISLEHPGLYKTNEGDHLTQVRLDQIKTTKEWKLS